MAPIRRFAAIGDIHAEDRRLEHVLAWLARHPLDAVLSVGDLCDGAGDLDRCITLLRTDNTLGVRGNHDRWFIDDPFRHVEARPATLAHLRALPVTRRVPTVRGDLLLCHGVGDHDTIRLHPDHDSSRTGAQTALEALLADPDLHLVVGGHTHKRMVRHFPRRAGPPLVFINPGTLHRDYPAGFAVVDLERRLVELHDLDERPGGALVIDLAETHALDP